MESRPRHRLAATAKRLGRGVGRRLYGAGLGRLLPEPPSRRALSLARLFPERMLDGPAASAAIADLLRAEGPCLVGRFGSTEMDLLLHHHVAGGGAAAAGAWIDRLLDGTRYGLSAEKMEVGQIKSGIFPLTREAFEAFCRRYGAAAAAVDLLASWVNGENLFVDPARVAAGRVRITRLRHLEPYYHANPWTEALAGRRVLVVHPFIASIAAQYHGRRQQLFADPRLLPEFELLTYRAVQSLGGQACGHASWLAALEAMEAEIAAIDFDVAILGCGGYGMPLGAAIRQRLGRKAVVLGGATQLLFGIKGLRWDRHPEISALYNPAWVRPLPEETAEFRQQLEAIEDGGYW